MESTSIAQEFATHYLKPVLPEENDENNVVPSRWRIEDFDLRRNTTNFRRWIDRAFRSDESIQSFYDLIDSMYEITLDLFRHERYPKDQLIAFALVLNYAHAKVKEKVEASRHGREFDDADNAIFHHMGGISFVQREYRGELEAFMKQ